MPHKRTSRSTSRETTHSRARSNSNTSVRNGARRSTSRGSKENVAVFTSLPPKVEGIIRFTLRLHISRIIWLKDESKSSSRQQRMSVHQRKKTNNGEESDDSLARVIVVRCVWWGEESSGSLFRPKVQLNPLTSTNKQPQPTRTQNTLQQQTTAVYMVRSGAKQLAAYLNDMKTLDMDLLDASTMRLLAKVRMHEIGQLAAHNPIKG